MEIIEAKRKEEFDAARLLFNEYTDSLGIDLAFQNYEVELRRIRVLYAPPEGSLILARTQECFAGCVALKKLDDSICEMKRLYVRPESRGQGIGKALCSRIIYRGRDMGFEIMRLDTLPFLKAALSLYREFGFREIPPYYDNPIPGTVYMELPLI